MKTVLQKPILIIILAVCSLTVKSQATHSGNKPDPPSFTGLTDVKDHSPQFIPGSVTVKLKEGVGEFGKQSGLVSFGIKSMDDKVDLYEVSQLEKRYRYNPAKKHEGLPDLSRIYKVSFSGKYSPDEVARSFSSDPNVEYAEPIPVYQVTEVSNDSLYSQLQHLPQIFAPQAWEIHKGEQGSEEIVVAIVDTGTDWIHIDLQSNIWQNLLEDADGDGHTKEFVGTEWVLDPGDLNGVDDDLNGFTDDLLGWNFITNTGDPTPIPGNPVGSHGTHCSGIANASTDNGHGIASISWNIKVMGICTDQNNTVPFGYDGIIYAAENGADFISNSWGGFPYSMADQEAINYAVGLGSVVLAAAGNSNNSELFFPADYVNVISVASLSSDDTKAWYSCYNGAVDISAPGGGSEGGILSTVPGNNYALSSGTSMACPLIAGCFGLLKSYHPEWTNEQLITQLMGTADNIDTLNPGFENMLGTGRVNAYRMLTEENVTMPQALKLVIASMSFEDANGNQVNEAGEEVILNIDFQNFTPYLSAPGVTVTLSTEDPDINILTGIGTVNIPADGIFTLDEPFRIEVGANASSHFAQLLIHFESEVPIVIGQEFIIQLLVAPSGIFVYDGLSDVGDFSGAFIANHLDQLGYDYTYSNYFNSLRGFETVFLSYGNYESVNTFMENRMADAIIDYLDSGGYVYLEGGDVFGWDQSGNQHLLELFGLVSATDGSTNPINGLAGQEASLTNELLFTSSSQSSFSYIDKLNPSADAIAAFKESNYGTVGVQYSIPDGHRTFCFSYALSKLSDGEEPNTRAELLNRLLNFFDLYTSVPDGEEPLAASLTVYPNPVNDLATFRYKLKDDTRVILEIYNPLGQSIAQPVNGISASGEHHFWFNTAGFAPGMYYYSFTSGNEVQTGKIVIR